MFWQRELLRDSVAMTFNQTYELDLPQSGQLGSLALYVRSAGNAGSLQSVFKRLLIDYISKIEVIGDGAEVIKSFDGKQAVASAFLDDGAEPLGKWGNYSGVTHRQMIPIHFGRRFYDELYGLDLGRFNQVTLKITNDATSTEFTTSVSLSVIAFWIREPDNPFTGYFREEEWKAYAPTNGETEYSILPIALPIRRILLRARPAVDDSPAGYNHNTITSQMSDVEFTLRSGQTRVFKGGLEILGWLSPSELQMQLETQGEVWIDDDAYFNSHLGYVTQMIPAAAAIDDPTATYPGTVVRADTQRGSQLVWNQAGTAPVEYQARGWGYMHQVPLFQATKPDMADLLQPEDARDVEVNIACTSSIVVGNWANAESAIILSRLVA